MSIVCDLGTGYLKLGWNTSTFPDFVIPNMYGYPNKKYKEFFEPDSAQEFFDEEINEHLWKLELHKPMEHGIVQDWESMTKILAFSFLNKVSLT